MPEQELEDRIEATGEVTTTSEPRQEAADSAEDAIDRVSESGRRRTDEGAADQVWDPGGHGEQNEEPHDLVQAEQQKQHHVRHQKKDTPTDD